MSGDGVMEAQQTFPFAGRGSIPTSPLQFKVMQGDFFRFSELLDKYHYKGAKIGGNIDYNLLLIHNYSVYGGIVIGKMRHQDNYEREAVELRRMVLDPLCPKNTASYFLSRTIRWLNKYTNVQVVYTFADTTIGHDGTCYKAANFVFVRETPPTTHVRWKGKLYHPRSLSIERPYSYELREAVENGEAEIVQGKPKLLYKYEITR